LRLFGAGHVVLPAPEQGEPSARLTALDPVFDPAPGARLYRVLDPLPRIYLAGRAAVPEVAVDDPRVQGFGAELFDPEILAGNLVHLDRRDAGAALHAPAGRAGACQLTAFGRSQLQARCRADRPAVAVILEQYAEGWHARVDGADTPLLLVNRLYRGVPLASGDHVIDLSFHPPGFIAGAAVSAISLALLGLLAFAGRRVSPRGGRAR
jgi:Bacterial membrane protein YfhO